MLGAGEFLVLEEDLKNWASIRIFGIGRGFKNYVITDEETNKQATFTLSQISTEIQGRGAAWP